MLSSGPYLQVPIFSRQVSYAKQAVLHLQQDEDSKVRELLKTTTEFVAGGLQLVSAAWNQDLSKVIGAIVAIKATAAEHAAKKAQPW